MGTKIVPASVADLQEINELFYKSKHSGAMMKTI